MKAAWTILATIALANIIAVVGLLAWLESTDRLDANRVERVRVLFSTTLADETKHAEEERARSATDQAAAAETARIAVPPEAAATKVARHSEAGEVQIQHIMRLKEEVQQLKSALDAQRGQIDRDLEKLQAERAAFADERQRMAEAEGSVQFKKALATLEGQKPKDAKEMLATLARTGKTDQVIAYLSAMEERSRSKVLAEFGKTDAAMAADLLERLRTRGSAAPPGLATASAPEAPPNDAKPSRTGP